MFETVRVFVKLPKAFLKLPFTALVLACTVSLVSLGQNDGSIPYKSQEMSEADGVPVLITHLPDWKGRRATTIFATNVGELKQALGERPLIDLIDFTVGTEAVTAQYDAGRLLIVEFASPHTSVETDEKINAAIAADDDGKTVNRRIGTIMSLFLTLREAGPQTL